MSNSKMSKSKRMVKVKLMELIDYAIGGAERGEINLNVMRAFFNSILEKEEIQAEMAFVDPDITKALRISEVKEDVTPVSNAPTGPPKYRIINAGTPDERKEYLDDREFGLCGRSSDLEFGCVSIGSVFKGTKSMEDHTQVLGDFVDQYNLLRHVNPYEQIHPTILSETWRMLKTIRTVFKNSSDLAEAQIIFDQYKDVMTRLRDFNDEIRKAVTELTKSAVDETGRPLFSDPFYAMKQALGKVNKVIDRFPDFELELKRINQKVGTGALPSNEFLEKMSSYGNMEALTQNNPITIVPIETRKVQGDPPPSKTFMALCLKLAQMIKYNEEKMRRLKAIEVHMEHLKLKNATKKEAQKLIERMAEVDGIGTAVERLLCRTQKCEDLICSMRQVVNKVYGCITANPNTRYESENIWACLFNQDENSRSGDNAENDLVSDAQMKSFHAQITKIDCEAKIVERNLMSVEAIKVDVKNLFSISNELEENKLDKCVVSTELAKKADRHMVDDKVTRFCFQQTCEGINAVISEILSKILETDKECHKVINFLTSKAHLKADYDAFSNLKEQAEYKLRCLAQRLTNLHNYKKNNSLNNSNTSARRVPTVPVAKHNKNKSNNKQDDDSVLNDNNISSNNNNNNNNNSCSSIYSSDSDTSDSFCECRSDFYSDDDDAERSGLGRFLSQLDKRSRGLVEICQSFKRINDSFRIMTQSMYDFDTFKELFEASKAAADQNSKADYSSNNDDDDLGSNILEDTFEGNKMLPTFREMSDAELPTFGEASA